MKKIDTHLHVNFKHLNADEIIRYMDDNSIEKCWLHTWEELDPPIQSLYQPLSVADVVEAYKHYPDRIIPFYAPDPASPTLRDDLKKYLAEGIRGCGELKIARKWQNEILEEYLIVISAYQLPLLFHMEAPRIYYIPERKTLFERAFAYIINGAFNGTAGYYIRMLSRKTSLFAGHLAGNTHSIPGYLCDFDFLERRLTQFPDVIFIGHGPHFWNNISTDLSLRYYYQKGPVKDFGIIDLLLEKYDNFYCDVSGRSGYYALRRDIDQTRRFMNRHAHKILFGTDNVEEGKLEMLIMSLGLSQEKLKQIFYNNARNIVDV